MLVIPSIKSYLTMSELDKKNNSQSEKTSSTKLPRLEIDPKKTISYPRLEVDPQKTISYRNDGVNPDRQKKS